MIIERLIALTDITFCGVWAGATYGTTQCPGTCEERMMAPENFVVRPQWLKECETVNLTCVAERHLAHQFPQGVQEAAYLCHCRQWCNWAKALGCRLPCRPVGGCGRYGRLTLQLRYIELHVFNVSHRACLLPREILHAII